ncbi:SDR family NAD(P)-dependent oxidoreductase [Streptomyces sp. NPDC058231]|uniref:SDR family NAD(P)-dependent oxidoreductase n=1 Tax=Streptomyces sp. NPDC058231 TaxID=3346392 RepID=UPI0036EEF09D
MVHNAGVAEAIPAGRDTRSIRGVLDVNLFGAYWMARAAATVTTRGGSIINVSSVLGPGLHPPAPGRVRLLQGGPARPQPGPGRLLGLPGVRGLRLHHRQHAHRRQRPHRLLGRGRWALLRGEQGSVSPLP